MDKIFNYSLSFRKSGRYLPNTPYFPLPFPMSSRLLSSLNDIEQALLKQSIAGMGLTWTTSRMVNYHHGLARMTLTPAEGAEPDQLRGAIFLQSYVLADGAVSFKASLNWHGCESFPVISVYAKPGVDWRAEASRIAAAWLSGPPAALLSIAPADTKSLTALTG